MISPFTTFLIESWKGKRWYSILSCQKKACYWHTVCRVKPVKRIDRGSVVSLRHASLGQAELATDNREPQAVLEKKWRNREEKGLDWHAHNMRRGHMLSCPIPRFSCNSDPAVTWLTGRDESANLWRALRQVRIPHQINSTPVRADSPLS